MSHRIVLVVECDSEEDMQACKRAIESLETLEDLGSQAMINGPTALIRTKDIQAIADRMFGLAEEGDKPIETLLGLETSPDARPQQS
jgi:hypothetical protein